MPYGLILRTVNKIVQFKMKSLYIIAGPNGAGKTTASYTILPDILNCIEFVNADEIAKGLSPFNPESAGLQSGRIMLKRIKSHLEKGIDFALETTLATKSYLSFIKKAQSKNYNVTLLFFWLDSVELAKLRVKIRVSEGGHNITEEVIERRYKNGLKNFFSIFVEQVDDWMFFNNSEGNHDLIAQGSKNLPPEIINTDLFYKIKQHIINE